MKKQLNILNKNNIKKCKSPSYIFQKNEFYVIRYEELLQQLQPLE